jgi:hypothetical protein
MKRTLNRILVVALVVAITVTGCDKSITQTEELQPLVPASQDADAETWLPTDASVMTIDKIKTIVETPTPRVFNDPAPVTSDAYKAELTNIKNLQKNLTSEQKRIIKYWSAGGVLRWNELLRKLVARYNLPPAPNHMGLYPVPDAENPFGDPNFPFANPPYAARAYSYVTIAQYEALKAAWHYMFQYNRTSPYKNDSEVELLMPETNLPSYPSHEAVMSGVSAEMMKLLFPAAVEDITKMAAEQRNAALWSGRASTSDIAAGLALGKTVAALWVTRARTDGTGGAGDPGQTWKTTEANMTNAGQTAWVSLENPKRPPMLPLFGKVKAWRMTADEIVANRPLPPPETTSADMQAQVDEVKSYAENLTRERLAIVYKWADGAQTYTPPGHWNDIAAEFISEAKFSEVRAARAFALLNMSMHDAAVGCWETKFFYYVPRPTQMNPTIKTATGVPNFPSFTSGHSTFSFTAATVLSYLFPAQAEYFNAEAQEASLSRLYAGIHYRIDIDAGAAHGKVIGGFTQSFAAADGADN